MKKNAKMMVMGLVLAMVFCYAIPSLAETTIGTDTAAARLIFQVNIMNYIEFRVGNLAANDVNTISFSPTMPDLTGSATITGGGGDVIDSTVSVRLLSNTPSITITATNNTPNGLANGGEFIDWESITTTEVGAGLVPPLLTNTGNTTSPTVMVGAQDITTSWQYSYTRRVGDPIPTQQGAYTGTITYTASTP